MVSSLTRTKRMGYTKDRIRLLKPQAPTCKGRDLGWDSVDSPVRQGLEGPCSLILLSPPQA